MIQIHRNCTPLEYSILKIETWYNKISITVNSDGIENYDIPDKWNKIKSEKLKIPLLTLTNGNCCYCGAKIKEGQMDVDHFLPKGEFPYLAYCWDNMLPSCKQCNQNIKREYVPPNLKDLIIVDTCLKDKYKHNYIFNKTIVYSLCYDNRLIDPSYDDVSRNLEFQAEILNYRSDTKLGKKTIELMFAKAEFEHEMNHLKEMVCCFVLDNSSQMVLDTYVEIHGYHDQFWALYDYWTDFFST